jgi:hypothetical protein
MLKSIIFATYVLTVVSAGHNGAAPSYSAPASFYAAPAYEQKSLYSPQRNISPARRNSAQTPVHKNRPIMLAGKDVEQNEETNDNPVSLEQNELKKKIVEYKYFGLIGDLLNAILDTKDNGMRVHSDVGSAESMEGTKMSISLSEPFVRCSCNCDWTNNSGSCRDSSNDGTCCWWRCCRD